MRIAGLVTLLVLSAALGGCVERKMVLRSDPQGALIRLDGQTLEQRTPAEVPFHWGGLRGVTLIAPGHHVLEGTAELEDPWYVWFPFDVFAEFLWPGTIEDVQVFDYRLDPYHPVTEPLTEAQQAEMARRMDELRVRAAEYRAGGSEGPGGGVRRTAPPDVPAGAAAPLPVDRPDEPAADDPPR